MTSRCSDLHELDAFIFDLDGVITRTAAVHFAAWKRLFDRFLQDYGKRLGKDFGSFGRDDYNRHVDGMPRYDGVRNFLASRGIDLPFGTPDDPPGEETVCALGNRKNDYFRQALAQEGVEAYQGTVEFIRQARGRGARVAVISASKNCVPVLEKAGLLPLFEAKVDGVDAAALGIAGKPAPDVFLEAARRLGVAPERSAVVEDALAGVRAGRAGGFACVIGIDRAGQAQQLREAGADLVVRDLAELPPWPVAQRLPSALAQLSRIVPPDGQPAVFLDYDGVLTPIVPRPEEARLTAAMREAVMRLAARCPVAIVSGRDLRDVQQLADIGGIVYAGSHGFDIEAPAQQIELRKGEEYLPALDRAEALLAEALASVPGARVERKKFAIAIHFRQVAPEQVGKVEEAVDAARRSVAGLRRTGGKKIFELRPDIDWDKGKAVAFLLKQLGLDRPGVFPLYLGDDLTDEDAFRALAGRGAGILVGDHGGPTAAAYRLQDCAEVLRFLGELARLPEAETG